MTNEPWPTEIRLKDKGRMLVVTFDAGETFELSAEYLRVMSPSAEVQGHSAAQKQIVGYKSLDSRDGASTLGQSRANDRDRRQLFPQERDGLRQEQVCLKHLTASGLIRSGKIRIMLIGRVVEVWKG